MQWLGALIVFGAVVAIFLTTPAGQRLAKAAGLRAVLKGRAPDQDRDYLLRVCDGDQDRLATLLEQAWRHDPQMTEAEAYRKAIRAHLRDKM